MTEVRERARWWTPRGIAGLLEALVVGEPPPAPPREIRPQRAVRAGVRKVRVDGRRLVWRSRTGTPGEMFVDEIDRVLLVHVDYVRNGVWGPPLYALVLDRSGAVRLRVVAGGSPRAAGPEGRRQLRELWSGAGVPVEWEATSVLNRPKDYRRRWPEAFRFAHAYHLMIAGAAFAAWMLLAVLVLE